MNIFLHRRGSRHQRYQDPDFLEVNLNHCHHRLKRHPLHLNYSLKTLGAGLVFSFFFISSSALFFGSGVFILLFCVHFSTTTLRLTLSTFGLPALFANSSSLYGEEVMTSEAQLFLPRLVDFFLVTGIGKM